MGEFILEDRSTWVYPLIVNALPCAFVVLEFIADALVFDITYFYIPVSISAAFMFINYIYTSITKVVWAPYF